MNTGVTAPPKLLFVNLASTLGEDELEVQFNPSELMEQIDVNWSHQTIPGQSHEPMQFVNTSNFKLDLDLFFRATNEEEMKAIHRARRLILSWAYPRDVIGDIIGGGAPRLLVYWAGMLSLTCILTSVEIRHTRFNKNARSVEFNCRIQLEEIRDTRLHFDEVAEDNVLRFGDGIGLEEG